MTQPPLHHQSTLIRIGSSSRGGLARTGLNRFDRNRIRFRSDESASMWIEIELKPDYFASVEGALVVFCLYAK